jgi:hypothetical protein
MKNGFFPKKHTLPVPNIVGKQYKGGGGTRRRNEIFQSTGSECSPSVLGLAVGALVEAARVYGNYLDKRIPAIKHDLLYN